MVHGLNDSHLETHAQFVVFLGVSKNGANTTKNSFFIGILPFTEFEKEKKKAKKTMLLEISQEWR